MGAQAQQQQLPLRLLEGQEGAQKTWEPPVQPSAKELEYSLTFDGEPVDENPFPQIFPERYSDLDAVLNFRNGPYRDSGAFGTATLTEHKLMRLAGFAAAAGGTPETLARLVDDAADVAVLEAPRDGHHLLQVLAVQL